MEQEAGRTMGVRLGLGLWMVVVVLAGTAAGSEPEVRALLARQEADWNRGDVEAFMTGYEDSEATTFTGGGNLIHGYQAVLERYRKNYPDKSRMGQLTFSEIEVRMLGRDAALVLGRFRLERTKEAGGEATGRYTLVLQRKAGRWKIIHDHTSS
jgi:uncharacterized protein (TIGR02246 family)